MREQVALFGEPAAAAPPDGMTRDAVLSPCGTYRYRLTRLWDKTLPVLGWIMLNPSTADASVDDPTIRKCVGFAKRGGFGSIVVTNLFAFRATDPRELKKRSPLTQSRSGAWTRDVSEAAIASSSVVGPENDAHIIEAAHEARLTILAWGAHGGLGHRDRWVVSMLAHAGLESRTAVLAYTDDKSKPRHPLYLKYELIDPLTRGAR